MKIRIYAVALFTLMVAIGCVKTVNDRKTMGSPFVNDKLENRYQRSVDQAYSASVAVIGRLGTVSRETIISPGTNEVKSIEGKVNERKVWVRVQPMEPTVTSVTVQVRTAAGASDKPLTHEIATQIALELAR